MVGSCAFEHLAYELTLISSSSLIKSLSLSFSLLFVFLLDCSLFVIMTVDVAPSSEELPRSRQIAGWLHQLNIRDVGLVMLAPPA